MRREAAEQVSSDGMRVGWRCVLECESRDHEEQGVLRRTEVKVQWTSGLEGCERRSPSPPKGPLASRKVLHTAGIAAVLIALASAMPAPAELPPIAPPDPKPAEDTLAEMVAVPAGSFFMGATNRSTRSAIPTSGRAAGWTWRRSASTAPKSPWRGMQRVWQRGRAARRALPCRT